MFHNVIFDLGDTFYYKKIQRLYENCQRLEDNAKRNIYRSDFEIFILREDLMNEDNYDSQGRLKTKVIKKLIDDFLAASGWDFVEPSLIANVISNYAKGQILFYEDDDNENGENGNSKKNVPTGKTTVFKYSFENCEEDLPAFIDEILYPCVCEKSRFFSRLPLNRVTDYLVLHLIFMKNNKNLDEISEDEAYVLLFEKYFNLKKMRGKSSLYAERKMIIGCLQGKIFEEKEEEFFNKKLLSIRGLQDCLKEIEIKLQIKIEKLKKIFGKKK